MPTFHKDPLKRLLADVRAHEDERRKRQEKHEISYQQALISTKEKIKQTEGPDMKERLQDQIRQWFIECRYDLNSLISNNQLSFIAMFHKNFLIFQMKMMEVQMLFLLKRILMKFKKILML
jgi:hypothetical protein